MVCEGVGCVVGWELKKTKKMDSAPPTSGR